MTIVVAAAAPDGIVLASDSRTTLTRGRGHRVATDHATKLYSLRSSVGVAHYGAALIGGWTITGLLESFISSTDLQKLTLEKVSEELAGFFMKAFEEDAIATGHRAPEGALGFLVAGFDGPDAALYEVLLPPHEGVNLVNPWPVDPLGDSVFFRGQTAYIERMLQGIDERAIKAADISLPKKVEAEIEKQQYVLKRTISVQDALDLAVFVVRTTIDMDRMADGTAGRPGIPGCGGEVQALVVTRSDTRWIAQGELRPRSAGSSA